MSRPLRIAREALVTIAGNKLRFLMMIAGIVIGIASLTVIICISQGTRQRVMALVASHGLDTLVIRPGSPKWKFVPGGDPSLVSLSIGDVKAIQASVPNAMRVLPVQDQRKVDAKYQDRLITTVVFGVTPLWGDVRRFGASEGTFISQEDIGLIRRVCLIGQTVKRTLFRDTDPVGQTIRIRNVPFTVKGVLIEKGSSALGNDRDNRVVIPLSTASKRLSVQTYLNQIVVQVRNVWAIHETAQAIRAVLRQKHGLRSGLVDDFYVREPKDLANMASGISGTLNALLLAMAGISMLVGGLVIMNIMLISVSQRQAEIGLRRAVGARKQDITAQILIECIFVALAGGLLGVLLGVGITTVLSLAGMAASKVGWLPFALSVVFCSTIAIAFGIYPAQKAGSIDPIDALQP